MTLVWSLVEVSAVARAIIEERPSYRLGSALMAKTLFRTSAMRTATKRIDCTLCTILTSVWARVSVSIRRNDCTGTLVVHSSW